MRWFASGHEMQRGQAERFARFFGEAQMAEVDRVEGAPEHADRALCMCAHLRRGSRPPVLASRAWRDTAASLSVQEERRECEAGLIMTAGDVVAEDVERVGQEGGEDDRNGDQR